MKIECFINLSGFAREIFFTSLMVKNFYHQRCEKCLTFSYQVRNTENYIITKQEVNNEKQREKKIGNRKVQRDLYSAFLIRNTDL